MPFAERLRELREKAGQTQEDLAEKSGVKLWTIRGYEQGRREPSLDSAFRLAEALGVPVEEFKNGMKTPALAPKAKARKRKGA